MPILVASGPTLSHIGQDVLQPVALVLSILPFPRHTFHVNHFGHIQSSLFKNNYLV